MGGNARDGGSEDHGLEPSPRLARAAHGGSSEGGVGDAVLMYRWRQPERPWDSRRYVRRTILVLIYAVLLLRGTIWLCRAGWPLF